MAERLQIFQDRLLLARRRIGMNQETLARKTRLFKTDISKYERGQGMPTLPKLVRLADALRTSVDALIGRCPLDHFSTYFCETEVDLGHGWELGQTSGAVFIQGPGPVEIQLDGFHQSGCMMEPRVPLDAVEAHDLVSWSYQGRASDSGMEYVVQLCRTSLFGGEPTYTLSYLPCVDWTLPLETGRRLAAWWTEQLLPEDTPNQERDA